MERTIFYIAVAAAVFVALGAAMSGPFLHFEVAEGVRGNDPVIEGAAGNVGPQTYQALEVEIEHSAAHIVVTPEDRQDIQVEITNPGRLPIPLVTLSGGELRIDGRLRGRLNHCRDDIVPVDGYGDLAPEDLPTIRLSVPMNVNVSTTGANTTEIGPSTAVDADIAGCGTTTIADVAGALDLDLAGGPTIRAGAARTMEVDLAGGGDVEAGAISESLAVSIAGGGDVSVASLTGAFDSEFAGSGKVIVAAGAITDASVDIAGNGEVEIAAPVQRLNVSIAGSGDVNVAAAVGDVDLEVAGSGSVHVQSVTGAINQHIMGSGGVVVAGGNNP